MPGRREVHRDRARAPTRLPVPTSRASRSFRRCELAWSADRSCCVVVGEPRAATFLTLPDAGAHATQDHHLWRLWRHRFGHGPAPPGARPRAAPGWKGRRPTGDSCRRRVPCSLYPLCRWFARVTRRRTDWWLGFPERVGSGRPASIPPAGQDAATRSPSVLERGLTMLALKHATVANSHHAIAARGDRFIMCADEEEGAQLVTEFAH